MRKTRLVAVTFAVCLALLAAQEAKAGPILAGYPQDIRWYEDANGTMGYSFTVNPVNSTYVVNFLGFFDSGGDGLAYSHDVGLWNQSTGTLLAHTTIGTGAPLWNGYRWLALTTPVTLSSGITYVLGAAYVANNTGDLAGSTASIDPSFNLFQSLYHDASGLPMPDTTWTTQGFFGPNLANQVPEPSFIMLLGIAIGAIGLAFKKFI